MSLECLSNETGIGYSQLSRIERGKINTSIYQIYLIIKTLNVPINTLLEVLITDVIRSYKQKNKKYIKNKINKSIMKKITLFLLSCVLFTTACNQSSTNPTVPNNPPLNATEQQLIGTWKLQRQTTFVGTTKLYDSTFIPIGGLYATFKTSITPGQQGVIPASNFKDIEDNAGLMIPNLSPWMRSLYTGNWYWYVSSVNNQLYVGYGTFAPCNIDTLTTTKLVLTRSDNPGAGGVQNTTLWFIK
jgi:transcriptional regulator with XRE-family HTH domain